MLKHEAAAYLAGLTSEDSSNTVDPTNVHVISGEVSGTSENGKVLVSIDGMVFSENDDQYIEVESLGGLEDGDIATILISGEPGHGMTPFALGTTGSVDRARDLALDAQESAQIAASAASSAQTSAEEAAEAASAAQDSADVAEQHAQQAISDAAVASTAAGNAQTSANVAEQHAQQAISDAATAATAASNAQTSADNAAGAASAAQSSANAAMASAISANELANGALLGLSTIEDVVDVVEWLSAHSKATDDTTVLSEKSYYVRDESQVMHRIESVIDPSSLGWVDAAESEDTEAVDGKTYYELDAGTGALTPVADVPEGANPSALDWFEVTATTDASMTGGKTYYTVDSGTGVASPLDPSALGWWEMDDAVTQYLASHIAMTNHGLNLMVDGTSGYIHLGTLDGNHEYGTYIIGGDGVSEANFGEHTRIGRADGMHVDITSDSQASGGRLFSIADGNSAPVMYVQVVNGESTVYMTNAVVVRELRFGNWMWYERQNGNMSVKWMGSDV